MKLSSLTKKPRAEKVEEPKHTPAVSSALIVTEWAKLVLTSDIGTDKHKKEWEQDWSFSLKEGDRVVEGKQHRAGGTHIMIPREFQEAESVVKKHLLALNKELQGKGLLLRGFTRVFKYGEVA